MNSCRLVLQLFICCLLQVAIRRSAGDISFPQACGKKPAIMEIKFKKHVKYYTSNQY